jgi:DNA modification methylase
LRAVPAKNLCLVPFRLALALQAWGWIVCQDIIWNKPDVMPESVGDRCTKCHEYVFLLTKSRDYHFDAEAIKEPAVSAGRVVNAYAVEAKNRSGDSKMRTREGLADYSQKVPETRNKRSVWTIPTIAFKEAHFATFPPDLVEPMILAGCPEGGVVLDPFAGAGTTGLVADRLKRSAVLIELNPKYAEMAARRIENDAGMFKPKVTIETEPKEVALI